MNNSGTEYNGVIVCGPPASPDPDYTYHNIVTICGQPASPDPEDIYNGKHVSPSPEMINYRGPSTPPNTEYSYNNTVTASGQSAALDPIDCRMPVSPSPEMMNYQTITTYGTLPSAYTVVTHVRGPSTPPNPDDSYHNAVYVCGQPASLYPVDSRMLSPTPEMIHNEVTVTGYGSPPSAYTVMTYVHGPSTPPNPEYSYNSTVTASGQSASLEPVDNRLSISPTPETVNYETVTGYRSSQSAYSVVTYVRSRLKPYSPISPAESNTYSESRFESSDLPGPALMSTPVKESAANYFLEPYVVTPTTSKKRIRRRHLNFRDPNLMYDLEDISEDESDCGEPLAQKQITEDIVMDNESMRAWINAIANLYKSRNE